MDPNERIGAIKALVLMASWFPVLAVCAPLINTYVGSDVVLISVGILLVPMLLLARGVRTLLLPEESASRPHAVALGTASVSLLLCLAPLSIWVAIKNAALRPSWLVLSLTGSAASVVYLSFAYRHWHERNTVT
jgi:hypothetical protein